MVNLVAKDLDRIVELSDVMFGSLTGKGSFAYDVIKNRSIILSVPDRCTIVTWLTERMRQKTPGELCIISMEDTTPEFPIEALGMDNVISIGGDANYWEDDFVFSERLKDEGVSRIYFYSPIYSTYRTANIMVFIDRFQHIFERDLSVLQFG